MKILIVSATELEVKYLLIKYKTTKVQSGLYKINFNNSLIFILISGIGTPSMTYNLTKAISSIKFDLVMNIGIAGAYSSFVIGEVVNVIQDEFGDLGIEKQNSFHTIFEEGFIEKNAFPFKDGKLISSHGKKYQSIDNLPTAKSITVNKTSGKEDSIKKVRQKFDVELETMEGAAVFHVCLLEKIPSIQIRAVSNKVEPYDKNRWNIKLALTNLEKKINEILNEICQ